MQKKQKLPTFSMFDFDCMGRSVPRRFTVYNVHSHTYIHYFLRAV